MLLKIGICDDESEYTTILADYLKTYDIDSEKDYSFQIDKFTSAKELLSAYTKPETYHILFLDVEMPEITGTGYLRLVTVRALKRPCKP